MEKISKHLFESTIWSIGYFGTKDIPKLWIELRSPTKTNWVSFDISKRMASDICSFDPSNKIKTWLKGVGNIGLFLRLKSGINPGIEALEAYDLASGNLIYDVPITHWIKFTHSHIQVVQEKALYWINLQTGHFEVQLMKAQTISFSKTLLILRKTNQDFQILSHFLNKISTKI